MARTARYTKEAVDQSAVEYWSDYFGPYGKAWTRDVARRVASAIAQGLQKAAAKDAPPHRVVKAQIGPIGWAQTPTGGLQFEGVFRGTLLDQGRPKHVLRAFCATFTPDGKLTDLKQLAA